MAVQEEDNEVLIGNSVDDKDPPEGAIEIVIEDDTPEADKGRKQIKTDPTPTDAELENYSEDVKKRMRELTLARHSERRDKDTAVRERDEALRVANGLLKEKNDIQARFAQGEEVFINQARDKATLSVSQAKQAYKDAYEAGDSDKMADAQEQLAKATWEREQAARWQPTKVTPQQEITLQPQDTSVYNETQPDEPDPAAVKWARKNAWFGSDKEMTAMAYGVHDRLIEEGITPTEAPDEYYNTIEKRIREKFPEYKWPDAAREKAVTVVAGVNRAPKSNRVTLTKSQVSIASRLGLTNEQYAKELAKLETR